MQHARELVWCPTVGMWECGSWAAMAMGKGFGRVENTPQQGKEKTISGYEVVGMAA